MTTVAITVAQIILGIMWPPPDFAPTSGSATSILEMAQADPILTFVKLDGLMIIDYLLLVVVFVSLAAALRNTNRSLVALGTTFALVASTLYFAVNPALTMFVLAGQYRAAADDGIVQAAQTVLANFQGTAFLVHYIVMGVAGMLVSAAMLRGEVFSRTTGVAGLLQGSMMLIPVTFGTIGLIFAVGSLVPFMVWFVLISRQLWKMSAAGRRAMVASSDGAM